MERRWKDRGYVDVLREILEDISAQVSMADEVGLSFQYRTMIRFFDIVVQDEIEKSKRKHFGKTDYTEEGIEFLKDVIVWSIWEIEDAAEWDRNNGLSGSAISFSDETVRIITKASIKISLAMKELQKHRGYYAQVRTVFTGSEGRKEKRVR